MPNVSLIAVSVAGAVLGGCAGQPFFKTDGPSTASGVTVALSTETCGRRYDEPLADVLDLTMQVRITNEGDTPASITPDELRLLVAGDATAPSASDPPQQIAPGASCPVTLHFHRYGDAKCNEPMQLSFTHAVAIERRSVDLHPLVFVPSRSDR
jgi:hypothetical protein